MYAFLHVPYSMLHERSFMSTHMSHNLNVHKQRAFIEILLVIIVGIAEYFRRNNPPLFCIVIILIYSRIIQIPTDACVVNIIIKNIRVRFAIHNVYILLTIYEKLYR